MECHSYQKLISRLVDGELEASLVQELSDHMAVCPSCGQIYQRMIALNRSLGLVRSSAVKPRLVERVKAQIANRRRAIGNKEGIRIWVRVPLMAMVALLALGLGNLAGKSINEIITSDRGGEMLEAIVPDQTQSFADVMIDLGSQENSR